MYTLKEHYTKGLNVPSGEIKKLSFLNKLKDSAMGNLATQDYLHGHSTSSFPASNFQFSNNQDPHEKEASQMADQIISMGTAIKSSKLAHNSGSIQFKRRGKNLSATNANSANVISGNGLALPEHLLRFFEPHFGQDLSHVRIHNNSATHQTANNFNARAFTQNNHIGFDKDQYSPHAREGMHLLAHELTHITQQTNTNKIYCKSWDVNDSTREIKREVWVQLNFKNSLNWMQSRSHRTSGTLNEATNLPRHINPGNPITQTPTVHEFGHFIGLDHPGAGLLKRFWSQNWGINWPPPLSPGADEYSHTGTDIKGRVGMGMRAFYFDAWETILNKYIERLRTQKLWKKVKSLVGAG